MDYSLRHGLKVCVIGAGQVGATFAYALMIRGLASEIVLIDVNKDLASGQAEDMSHGLPYVSPTKIFAGDYGDCEDADIVVISAGAAQKSGETRLDLTKRNVDIMAKVVPDICRYASNAILIILSNPVDILTYAAYKFSGLPQNRVLGSGTALDSSRFRYLLSQHIGVDPRNVHAYIIGEHGDSEVPVWSLVHVSGVQLDDYCQSLHINMQADIRNSIFEQVRDAAYHLIEKKGATYHAIGLATLNIVESIARDQNTIYSVSSYISDYHGISDVCASVPCKINRDGVNERVLLRLSSDELAAFKKSIAIIKETIISAGL
ncbi:L-lactate dehydrogenase [candidate division KSB1 bacterium]|nr:L-lactate dehydrogenase [candidate division KSB1 bacterium]RQW00623.1 MAG: L-lactate dehydrogenase [candidate division KSB1 bacterium]